MGFINKPLKDGDIVFFSGGKKNTIRKLITWFSNGPNYHVGVAVNLNVCGKHMVGLIESHVDGPRVVNLDHYSERDVLIYRLPIDGKMLCKELLENLEFTKYRRSDLIVIGLMEKFGIKPIPRSKDGAVCSVFVAEAIKKLDPKIDSVFISPQRLFEMISKHGVLVFSTHKS